MRRRAPRRGSRRSAGRRGGRGRRAARRARWTASRHRSRAAARGLADVGPGVELVPAADELAPRGVVDGRQAARGEQLVERRAVQLVERPARALPAVGLLERRRVARAPVVGQLGRFPVDAGGRERPRDARAPVDQGAEDVEDERADGHARRLTAAGGAGLVPDATLALARVLVPARGVLAGLLGSAIRSAAWRSGAPFGKSCGLISAWTSGVSPSAVSSSPMTCALGRPPSLAVAQGVLLVAAVARHLTLPELPVRQGVHDHDDRDEDDGDGPGDPSRDGGDGRDDGEEDRGEHEEGT